MQWAQGEDKGYAASVLLRGIRKQAHENIVNCLVAFTRDLPESSRVRNGDATSALSDPPCGLETLYDGTDRRTLDPHPICPEFVREGDHLLINPMARAQDQASTTGFNTMDCVTGDILENPCHESLHEVAHEALHIGACADHLVHLGNPDPRCCAGEIHQVTREGPVRDCCYNTQDTFAAIDGPLGGRSEKKGMMQGA
jgi:hypothetical protein